MNYNIFLSSCIQYKKIRAKKNDKLILWEGIFKDSFKDKGINDRKVYLDYAENNSFYNVTFNPCIRLILYSPLYS